jgi:hypothetical protein
MIKLKNILSEAYAWERQEGKPLPTLKDVQEAYDAKGVEDAADEANEGAKPDYIDLDKDGDEKESMKDAAEDAKDEKETNEGDDMNHSYHTDEDDKADWCESCHTMKESCSCGEKETMEESFNKRMLGNLHGSEYILRETFRG